MHVAALPAGIGINFALSQLAGQIIQGAMADNAAIEAAMAAAKARNEHSELHAHSEIQAAKEDIDPDAQAHVDANAQGSDLKACLMDLLNALDMKFDIGRKMASSRSGGRMHVLASYAGHRVEVDLHFGSSI